MYRLTTLALAASALFVQACCDCPSDEPPPIAPLPEEGASTGGEDTTTTTTTATQSSSGVSEADAVSIAINLAEQQGHDLSLYEDITVHHAENGDWLVQLRRPMYTRFLEVTVNKTSGEANLTQRATTH